ncbi:MAG: hypothetical protein AAF572_02540 [Cyanobacteria bacterium P01_B01_bin.77]
MTTQTMTNELSLDQLDSVSGGFLDPVTDTALVIAVVVTAVAAGGAFIAGAAAGYVAGGSVKADENGNGDYRTGPQNSPNSPPNPFG